MSAIELVLLTVLVTDVGLVVLARQLNVVARAPAAAALPGSWPR